MKLRFGIAFILVLQLYIWNISEPGRACKSSPDLCVGAAFERKAGSPFLNGFYCSASKKIQLFKR